MKNDTLFSKQSSTTWYLHKLHSIYSQILTQETVKYLKAYFQIRRQMAVPM